MLNLTPVTVEALKAEHPTLSEFLAKRDKWSNVHSRMLLAEAKLAKLQAQEEAMWKEAQTLKAQVPTQVMDFYNAWIQSNPKP